MNIYDIMKQRRSIRSYKPDPVEEEKLTANSQSDSSRTIRARVIQARNLQKKRFNNSLIKTNGEMKSADIRHFSILSNKAIDFLKQAISRLTLSARSYFKLIKVSQTIADLDKKETIDAMHVAEALQYRVKEE